MPSKAGEKPTTVIPVAPFDYRPPAPGNLLQRIPTLSLNFVDEDHLLFTFHRSALLTRVPDARAGDDDQIIHALVLELPSGRVSQAADWRMHDHGGYIWPLHGGKYMVRSRETLYVTDSSLSLVPYLRFEGALVSIQVSPDGRMMVTENQEEPPAKSPDPSPTSVSQSSSATQAIEQFLDPSPPVHVRLIRLDTKTLVGETRTRAIPKIPVAVDGYIEMLRGNGSHWLVNFSFFNGPRHTVADVDSSCQPTVQFLSARTILVTSCNSNTRDHFMKALSLDGTKLWEHRVDGRRVWPAFAYAEDGSRFAVETLVSGRPVGTMDPVTPEDVRGQVVDVYDTQTGKLLLEAPSSPVIDAGQNFALSPSGRRFAVLHDGAIEVYDLKSVSSAEPAAPAATQK